jgi:D-alanine transaminase
MRISYLNGKFLPHEDCFVHIEDRGFQLGDGVYEVTLFKNNKLIDGDLHLNRLFRSLEQLKIEHNFTKEELLNLQLELFKQNNMNEGTCYLAITRGVHKRIPNHPKNVTPTINLCVSKAKEVSEQEFENGFSIMTHEDIRWSRCDIKSLALLASSLINQKSKDLGFNDVVFVRDGFVTEASYANAFIIDEDNKLITRNADNFILQGITRNRLIDLAKKEGIEVEERKFTPKEMINAKEVFLSSSSMIIRPVTKIDGEIIGSGKVGKITKLLKRNYQEFINF